MKSLVVFREFEDGDHEIGVVTLENNVYWIHVGDFDYVLEWCRTPFIIIGTL